MMIPSIRTPLTAPIKRWLHLKISYSQFHPIEKKREKEKERSSGYYFKSSLFIGGLALKFRIVKILYQFTIRATVLHHRLNQVFC